MPNKKQNMIHKMMEFFEKRGIWATIFLAVIASFLYSCLSVLRHMHFQSGAFDLGIYDQALWQYAHFLYPFSTIKYKIILGDHFNLILPLLAPLYWIWDDVRILLIFQAVWVSFSTVGIYLFLRKRLGNSLSALVISLSYLLFYGIQFGIYFDFHPILFAVGLMSWMLYFWEAEKWKLFWIFCVLLLLTQENAGVALVGLCCIWFFQRKRIRLIGMLAVVGVAATALSFFAIHLFSSGHLEYVPHFANNIQGIVSSFFDKPEKREVWWYSYVSFAFLPIFSPGSVLAVVGDLSQYFITGEHFNHMWSPFLHHRAILSVFLIAGLSDVLVFISSKQRRLLVPLAFFIALWAGGIAYHYHFALTKLAHKDYWHIESWAKDDERVIQRVPLAVSLAAQQSLVPHVSHRNKIFLVYPRQHDFRAASPCGQKTCWWLDFDINAQYLFVDVHPSEWATMTLEDIGSFRSAVRNMEKVGAITKIDGVHDALFYKVNTAKLQKVFL